MSDIPYFKSGRFIDPDPCPMRTNPMTTKDKIERVEFLRRNIGDWSEKDADDVCKIALEALRALP